MSMIEQIAHAWTKEYDAWGMRRSMDKSCYEAVRFEPGQPICEETQTIVNLGSEHTTAQYKFHRVMQDAAARAVLKALRDPTPAMIEAGMEGYMVQEFEADHMPAVWALMIDKAMEDAS